MRTLALLVGCYLVGPATVAAVLTAHAGCNAVRAKGPRPEAHLGHVEPLVEPRRSPHAYGRSGDLLLHGAGQTSLTFAAAPDQAGHRPLRGALLDVQTANGDRPDCLLWWRAGWLDAVRALHVRPATTVAETRCEDGAIGVRIAGEVEDVALDTSVCPTRAGFAVTTSAQGLPQGARIADDLNPGTAEVLLERDGDAWEGERPSAFVALADNGVGLVLEAPGMRVQRRLVHIAAEAFPAPLVVSYEGDQARRTLQVVAGDGLDALASAAASTRTIRVAVDDARGGDVAVLATEGHAVAHGRLPPGGQRTLRLPPDLGASLELRDSNGVVAGEHTLAGGVDAVTAPAPWRAKLVLRYRDDGGALLPVHVVLRGLGTTPDPTTRAEDGAFAAGRSIYLVRGEGTATLAPGRYQVVASHGPAFTLSTREVELDSQRTMTVDAELRRVVDTSAWIAADFHLHAAPSPDAPVSLDERVASLACEGVDLAVATDHNRITDYAPSVRGLGLAPRLDTIQGDEITSAGAHLWGHFNAYPLPAPMGAPEEAVPPYFDLLPGAMFAAARAGGARVIQVNHPRMEPRIGYFDLTHLDPSTGSADDTFSPDFDAVEAFNGIWLESPSKIRQGALDLVALARRGMRPAATGNSDSHRLLYEEAGYPRTYVHAAAQPVEGRGSRALDALLRRDTTVSSGPFVELTVNGAPVGSTVAPRPGGMVRAHIRVTAPAWVPVEHVELWRDGLVTYRAEVTGPPLDGVRFEHDVDLAFETDGVLLAWAEAETPLPDVLPYASARAVGFTGLVYVDADGDGRVRVPSPMR